MNIHEYQAKNILTQYGIKVPNGFLVESINELESKGRLIQTDKAVVKAQIHAGGRGKAGGVKLVDSLTGVIEEGTRLLGSNLVTHQTGPSGKIVNKVYLEEACDIVNEFYLSMVVDRNSDQIAVIASKYGGVDIEETAKIHPESIETILIDPVLRITDYQSRELSNILELHGNVAKELKKLLNKMYLCFIEKDCAMIEINPLIKNNDEELIVLDAKMSFDSNALYRHSELQSLKDISEESDKEIEAFNHGLAYVSLDGNVGCLVNGAGLAMATMDAIYHAGGKPANFLDVGGSATVEQISNACKITLSDKNVKGLFVNIFGGIMHCDTVAKGVVEALRDRNDFVSVVVRLDGTNVKQGLEILKSSKLKIDFATTIDEGARKIVKNIGGE